MYTIVVLLCDLGVGRQTKREGVPRWWCIFFLVWKRGLIGKMSILETLLRRLACRTETAPEKLLNRYEKRFEKREKDPKNDPKRV